MSLTDSKMIQEDYARIAEHLCGMDFGEHNMLVYPDRNTLHDVYCSHVKKSLTKDDKAVIILSHYETPQAVKQALKEVDILIEKYEPDHSLMIFDATTMIYKAGIDIFFEYLQSLEVLALKGGKSGLEVIHDMGSFYHLGRHAELVQYENACQKMTSTSKSSILCCYHARDLASTKSASKEQLHECHSKSYVINDVR